jgi:hypothetical protein
MNQDLTVNFVKTGYGTNFHAIREFASGTLTGYYMWHNKRSESAKSNNGPQAGMASFFLQTYF